ncbi:FeoB-associated Cys-rich membrane protein [uncultured Sanguibacteroides sp.]|nr:FeoB-associated Cys-rich membrane protein [uncultured Sanguibacteroides sp.]
MQLIFTYIIIAVAIFVLGRGVYRLIKKSRKGGGCCCGCDKHKKSCL